METPASPNPKAPGSAEQSADPPLPVLIVAPLGNDAVLTARFLSDAQLYPIICTDLAQLCDQVEQECGAILIAEEALNRSTIPAINRCLQCQPSWSDIPIVVIASGAESIRLPRRRLIAFAPSGNVSLIERPFHPETLVSALVVALRARRRQYQVRDLLERSRQDAEILAQQANALRLASVRKDEFLAMLAHELRNPLASISNAVTLLREADDDGEWAMEVIARQTHQLTRMVDDLLDVSRITRGKIQLRKALIDAADCLRNAAAAAAPLMAERGHTFHRDIPQTGLWTDADPARLEQVFANLLTNAVKFTPTKGEIWLSAGNEGAEVVVTVRDSGIGMAPENLPGMFELFAQGERSPGRTEGGLGIGLTLVRRLCEMHNGSVSGHSDGVGKGCTFVVRLPAVAPPVARTPAPADLRPAKPTTANSNERVLVVDDNVDTATGLARLLSRRGYAVQVAHDGPSAIDLAESFAPRIVLLDIGLPGMDGYEVVRRLRDQPNHEDCTIIAVSGYGQAQDLRASLEAGFDHHVVKPVNLDTLDSLMAKASAKG